MAKKFSNKPIGPKRTAKGVMGKFQQNEFDRKQRIRQELKIHPELEPYIPPLKPEEFATLEASILEENRVREKLLVWQTPEEEYLLLDGHHRYKVVKKHEDRDLTWDIEIKEDLTDLEDAKRFMRKLQFGRRNLTTHQMAYLRGRTYVDMKKAAYRPEGAQEATGKTKEILAAEFKVGSATIERDTAFCRGVDRFSDKTLPSELQEERDKILLHDSVFLKGEIEMLGKNEELAVELVYDFKQAGGDLKALIKLPKQEWNRAMKAFVNGEESPAPEPTVKEAEKTVSSPADRFEKWWKMQDRDLGKILKSKDHEAIEAKKQELLEQAARINTLLAKFEVSEV